MTRLRRSDVTGVGITRRKCGKGFSYSWTTGERVTDPDVIRRVKDLVLPPAWSDVWICPWPGGHIQAIGTDAAGRRQYRYHDAWRVRMDKKKYERALAFGLSLPALREAVRRDLALPGLGRRRVLATGVRLLDVGCFRIGGEEYAEENDTFGIATLRHEHVVVRKGDLLFEYPAKGSIVRSISVADPDVRKVVRSLRRGRAPSDDLLAWKSKGEWIDVRSEDLNDYIKEEVGAQFSAKDFRTWRATVQAAVILSRVDPATLSMSSRRRVVAATVREVAEVLGNTPAVCRSSYIDPRVIDRFNGGQTIAPAPRRPRSVAAVDPILHRGIEKAIVKLIGRPQRVAA